MRLRIFLLSGATLASMALPALADDAEIGRRLDRMQRMIERQQREVESQKKGIATLNSQLHGASPAAAKPAAPPPAAVETHLVQQDQKIDALVTKFAAQADSQRLAVQEAPQTSVSNGRLSVTSADGRFSAALRLTGQYDMGYYMQGARARTLSLGPDLSSGSNFRRAQIGLQGKIFGDWSYYFNMDYGSGGSTGTETPGHIQQAYLEYDGLAPFAFRIGAHPPSTGLDDSYAATDSIFLERSSPGDAARNMAGGDGRDSVEVLYTGTDLFASLAYTGDKVQATSAFDEQQAVVARVAYTPFVNNDWRWVISGAGTYVYKPADTGSVSASARPFTISNPPEIIVDDNSTKFVSAALANATDAWNWNLESAVTYQSVLAQAGYFKYGMDQRGVATLRGFGFDGWYAEAAWVLTGEARGWSAANGAFTSPRPRINFSSEGGLGAWEVAARFSSLNLNDHEGVAGSALPAGGMRGGKQDIATLGLNWYPNTALKFALQLQNTQVSRIGDNITPGSPAGTVATPNFNQNQRFNTVAFRSQIAF